MKHNGLLSGAKKWLSNNSSTILTVIGAVGVVATAVMTAKAAPKALELIKGAEKEKYAELTGFEKIQVAAPAYAPAVAMGTATIACIFGANALNKRQQAVLASAYAVINQSYKEYKDKVKELYGEEVHQNIVDSIVKEKAKETHITAFNMLANTSLDFGAEDEEIRTFYDRFSDRYFESTISRVLEAEYHLNRNFMLIGDVSLNDFYEFLGLDETEYGSKVGWSICDDLMWIDFDHHKTVLEDGMEVFVIDMVCEPRATWEDA